MPCHRSGAWLAPVFRHERFFRGPPQEGETRAVSAPVLIGKSAGERADNRVPILVPDRLLLRQPPLQARRWERPFRPAGLQSSFEAVQVFLGSRGFGCPCSAGVQSIPSRSVLSYSAFACRMIPEPVDEHIPEGLEPLDQQRFAEWNPNIIGYQITAREVFGFEAFGCRYRGSVVVEAPEKRGARVGAQTESAFSRARRDRSADIDRLFSGQRAGRLLSLLPVFCLL